MVYAEQHSITRSFLSFYERANRLRPPATRRPVLAAAAGVMRTMETATLGAGDNRA